MPRPASRLNYPCPISCPGPAGAKAVALRPWQAGGRTGRELGIDPAAIVKLASNENPLGASPKALEAIRAELAELTRYPDGNGFELKRKLAERCAVDAAQVTLGNGSNDILDLVARAYLAPGLNAVFSEHAFAVTRSPPRPWAPRGGRSRRAPGA